MKFYKGIPPALMTGVEMINSVEIYDHIDYRINDIFITEPAHPKQQKKQVITQIGQKRKVNLVMSGTVMNNVNIPKSRVSGQYSKHDKYNLKGETINFSFFGIRIKRNPTAELYLDNNCLFYDNFFKVICVNDGIIDIKDSCNVSISYEELREMCQGKIETIGTYETLTGTRWQFKYKGDNDGD